MLVRSSRKEECRAAVFVVVVVAGAGCCCWHTGSGNKGVKRDRGERRRRDYKERGKGSRRSGGERQRERERERVGEVGDGSKQSRGVGAALPVEEQESEITGEWGVRGRS